MLTSGDDTSNLTTTEVLFLFEGVNDIDFALNALPPDEPVSIAPIANALRSMALTAQGLGVEVLLATLTPIIGGAEVRKAQDAVAALNREIRSMGTALGLGAVVDLHAGLSGRSGMIGADGIHPTATGYRRMAELFFAEIVARHDITPRAPAQRTPGHSVP